MSPLVVSTEQALLRAICEVPDDDTPRLAYADWLDEQGDGGPCRTCGGKGRVKDKSPSVGRIHTVPDGFHEVEALPYWYKECGACGGSGRLPNPRAEFVRVQCEKAVHTRNLAAGIQDSNIARHMWLDRRERKLLVNFPAAPYWLGGNTDPLRDSHPGRDIPQGKPAIRCFGGGVQEVVFEFSRGFVSAVTCDVRTFIGGPCVRCEGRGTVRVRGGHGDWDTVLCRTCNPDEHERMIGKRHPNAGHTPGIAADLFRSAPIERVTLADHPPHELGNAGWCVPMGNRLPEGIWKMLYNGQVPKVFPTRALALDALSDACVRYGRKLVGLEGD